MLKALLRYGARHVRVSTVFKFRATSRRFRDRPFFIFQDRPTTYGETYRHAVRFANVFRQIKRDLVRQGRMGEKDPLPIGLYMENRPEFLFAYFGAALSGDMIYGVNTGFRGETLVGVLEGAGARLVLVDTPRLAEIRRHLDDVTALDSSSLVVVDQADPDALEVGRTLDDLIAWGRRTVGETFDRPPRASIDNTAPFVVIYTSGTTGAPKGVVCSQWKLAALGIGVSHIIKLTADDRGYVCMPLFHSNAFFLGVMPLLVRGASFVLTPRFSASAFERDILEHGCTYMNYVGQPIHYILKALEKKYGDDETIVQKLARHPKNRFRIAMGNGALPVDRARLMRLLKMEHIYELYGSSEAAISTINKPGDPHESLGRVRSKRIMILDENDRPCPPGIPDGQGGLLNYNEAVGEIVKKMARQNIFFDGYHKDDRATNAKYRGGYYRSGDLGHIRIVNRKRYLYFDGRTDDWIRKDGENFSAENVTFMVSRHPDVALAVSYGVPCAVSDERVMTAIQLAPGAEFDPQGFFDFFIEQQQTGGMDPKWLPDYVRIMDEFDMTETQKIRVRPLKSQHFNLEGHPDMVIYHRTRGDTAYHPFAQGDYAELKHAFETVQRQHLLEQY